MKKCSKCKKFKPFSEFYKDKRGNDGLYSRCKKCHYIYSYHKEYMRQWRFRNEEYNREYNRKYKKEWRKTNSKRLKEFRRNNPQYRLYNNMGVVIWLSLKSEKAGRKWETQVDYNLEQLKQRLECQFKESMSWDNYGEWHVDHKKPRSLFNYNSAEDKAFKDCWSLANLQPLWASENLSKHNKFLKK